MTLSVHTKPFLSLSVHLQCFSPTCLHYRGLLCLPVRESVLALGEEEEEEECFPAGWGGGWREGGDSFQSLAAFTSVGLCQFEA